VIRRIMWWKLLLKKDGKPIRTPHGMMVLVAVGLKKQCHQTKVRACWLMTGSVVVICFCQPKKKYMSFASLAKAGS